MRGQLSGAGRVVVMLLKPREILLPGLVKVGESMDKGLCLPCQGGGTHLTSIYSPCPLFPLSPSLLCLDYVK